MNEDALKAHVRAQPSDFDAVRETVKQLHWGSGEQMQTYSKVTERIIEELVYRGWTPPAPVTKTEATTIIGIDHAKGPDMSVEFRPLDMTDPLNKRLYKHVFGKGEET